MVVKPSSMSLRKSTYGGLIWWNHTKKEIHVKKCLNPPTYHARFLSKLRVENPDYILVEDWLKP